MEHGTAQRSREKPAPPTPQGRLVKHHLTKGRGTGSATQRKTAFPSPFWLLLLPLSFSLWCGAVSLPPSGWCFPPHFPFVWCRFLPPHVGCLHSLLLWAGAAVFPTPVGGGACPLFQPSQQKQRRLHHPKGGGKTAPPTRERKRAAPDQRRREGDSSTSLKTRGEGTQHEEGAAPLKCQEERKHHHPKGGRETGAPNRRRERQNHPRGKATHKPKKRKCDGSTTEEEAREEGGEGGFRGERGWGGGGRAEKSATEMLKNCGNLWNCDNVGVSDHLRNSLNSSNATQFHPIPTIPETHPVPEIGQIPKIPRNV